MNLKFRLSTVLALTAVAGVLFFLARLNPWLPVLLALMLGPATLAFVFNRGRIVQGTTCSLAFLFSLWLVVPDFHDGWTTHSLNVDGGMAVFWLLPTDSWSSREQFNRFTDVYLEYNEEGFGKLGEYKREVLIINWRLILMAPFVYGIALHVLARWLDQPKAA